MRGWEGIGVTVIVLLFINTGVGVEMTGLTGYILTWLKKFIFLFGLNWAGLILIWILVYSCFCISLPGLF